MSVVSINSLTYVLLYQVLVQSARITTGYRAVELSVSGCK